MPTVKPKVAWSEASAEAIDEAAGRLTQYLSHERWLGNNNRYLRRPVAMVIKDADSAQDTHNEKHLSEYIAASAVLHCGDGWAYLGRAIGALIRGDASIARHLGYYAELRAALSVLASQGIGVFTKRNAVVDQDGMIKFFSGATHNVTWEALEHWADEPRGAAVLSSVLRPDQMPMKEWVTGLGLGESAWSPVGRQWLKAWGVDLRNFARDRSARNDASYRPTGVRGNYPPDASKDAEFVRQLWRVLSPSPGEPFGSLDRHILRLTLERAYEATTGARSTGSSAFRRVILNAIGVAGLDAKAPLARFLLRQSEPTDSLLIVESRGRASTLQPGHHFQVLARAVLLLRLATGVSNAMLERAALEASDLRFWANGFAERHGICQPNGLPEDPADLWVDVEEAIKRFQSHTDAGGNDSFFSLINEPVAGIEVLAGCERVPLWALAA